MCRTRWSRRTLPRAGSRQRGPRSLLRRPRAEPRQGRPRRLCRRPCRRHLADDRPRAPQGRHRVATPGYGTAIGDALGRGVDLTRLSTGQGETAAPAASAKSTGAIVLLSDGTQTHGVLTPDDGARLAKEAGIPVYTIALGTLTGTVTINRNGSEVVVPVPPDRTTLAQHRRVDGGLVVRRHRRGEAQLRLRPARQDRRHDVEAARGHGGVRRASPPRCSRVAIGLAALSAPRLP